MGLENVFLEGLLLKTKKTTGNALKSEGGTPDNSMHIPSPPQCQKTFT
jgi:hypothetical protein